MDSLFIKKDPQDNFQDKEKLSHSLNCKFELNVSKSYFKLVGNCWSTSAHSSNPDFLVHMNMLQQGVYWVSKEKASYQ